MGGPCVCLIGFPFSFRSLETIVVPRMHGRRRRRRRRGRGRGFLQEEEANSDGWEVDIVVGEGENAREPIVRAREGEGEGRKATVGLISQGYIWNLMEAEFCRPPSVLCTQADFSRGLAYKSI